MKTVLLFILSVFIGQYALAQPIKEPIFAPPPPPPGGKELPAPTDTIYAIALVDTPPMFPGGEDSLKSYIYKNLRYPELAKENDIQGTVYASFIIDKTGKVTNPVIKKGLKGVGVTCDNEVLRLIKNMPNWSPGKLHGKPVKVEYIIPVKFNLR
jgi:protein TonB